MSGLTDNTKLLKRLRPGLLVLSTALGALAVCGNVMQAHDSLRWSISDIPQWLFYSALAFLVCIAGEYAVRYLQRSDNDSILQRKINFLNFQSGWQQRLIITVIIFLFWLPYLLYLYPGVIWYDTANQLLQWNHLPNLFTSGQITDHHPIFDTMVFGLFVQLGNLIGSGDYGVFLYSLIQSAITACVLAYCLQYMRQLGVSRRMLMLSLAFFCLFPIFPMYSSAMAKDSLFLPIFVLFVIQCAQLVQKRGERLINLRPWMALLVISLLMALTKKTGVYIALVVELMLFVYVQKKARLRLAAVMIIVTMVMTVILPKVVFPIANIQPGGKQEMLAVPFQQSARLMRDHGDSISENQRDSIQKILGKDVARRYVPGSADYVKGFVWDNTKNKYLPRYAKAWFEGLIQHPLTYAEAYAGLEYAWLAMPNASDRHIDERLMPVYAQGANHGFFSGHEQVGFTGTGLASPERAGNRGARVERIILWLEQTPIGMVLFSRAIWSTWITAFLVYQCLRRRRRGGWIQLLRISPLAIAYASLWISPVSASIEAMRYVVSLVCVVPLACAILAVHPEDDETR
ncbi:DUF6020 family protein [Bifidobacterium sp. SO4]|uniref:DUF6020 family protein n=1 Tax=Bifidobacterium sp. SO4 TaxID=2809030 RepID=UPI001BDD629D|nr:DUF6020 family protein [Bifidobacterium sp. SO4]MBT1171515.1 hypothetical protein [Bifidobacterium sp. SO4]